MRILHSADLHLREDSSRTLDGLHTLLTEAADRRVDVLTLSGDIFDSPEDANRLRPRLRNELADNPFDIVAIPGNHDTDCYERSLEFGQDLVVLHEDPFDTVDFGDERIVGVPYRHTLDDELFAALVEAGNDGHNQILLLHCTLDIGFGTGATGAEETTEYFPIHRETLGEFGFEHVLAGHIHADYTQTPLSNGGQFIYPGNPVSHSRTETGPRHAVLVDTDEDRIDPIRLDTFYYDRFRETLTPGHEDALLDELRDWTETHDGASCELKVSVSGFTERDEDEFDPALRSAAGPASVTNETRTVQTVLDHPLFVDFTARLDDVSLEEWDHVDDRSEVETHVLEVMAELLDNREIRS